MRVQFNMAMNANTASTAICAMLLACSGLACRSSSEGLERVLVSGEVHYQGRPVQRGEIRFVPEDGTRGPVTVAVIELEGEIEAEQSISGTSDFEGGSTEFESESTEESSIQGEVLWNIAGGHLHSLKIEIETESSSTQHSLTRFGDQEFENDAEVAGAMTAALTVTVEETDED